MAKSVSIKWCIVIVALLVFIVYDRHRTTQPTAVTSQQRSMPIPDSASGNKHYAAIPAPQPMERLENASVAPLASNRSADSVEVEIPLLTIEENDNSLELDLEEFVDHQNNEPDSPIADESIDRLSEKLPQPSNWNDDNQNLLPETDDRFASVLDVAGGTKIAGFETNEIENGEVHNGEAEVGEIESAAIKTDTPTLSKAIQNVNLARGVQFKVVDHIEYGKSLARRGATFGAQQEFLAALRLVAQTIDNQMSTRESTDRLFVALLALKESDDFYYAQAENNGRVDVATIALHHQSKILNSQQLSAISPMEAMQAYYDFVQLQLVACSGHTVVAGEALYCLGKLYNMNANSAVGGSRLDNAKAIVFHGAALQCDSRNYKSANELGVLFSKSGRFDLAKKLLLQSLRIRPLPKVWENLAFVHQQLGEPELAQRAEAEYQQLLDAPSAPQTARIQWVSPEKFAEQSAEPVELRTAAREDLSDEKQTTAAEPSSFKKALNRWF